MLTIILVLNNITIEHNRNVSTIEHNKNVTMAPKYGSIKSKSLLLLFNYLS